MREILFKAKRKNWRELPKEEWYVEGYPVKYQPCASQNKWIYGIVPTYASALYVVEIAPKTLCQYTGLNDKNGNRIWENDICDMVYDGRVNIYVIVWDAEELYFKGTNGKEKYGSNFEYLGCCEEIVRIGNVFENPELLKGEDKCKLIRI